MNFFTTPNSKNIIATLRIVTIEKSELTFLLILYFHAQNNVKLIPNFYLNFTLDAAIMTDFNRSKMLYSK